MLEPTLVKIRFTIRRRPEGSSPKSFTYAQIVLTADDEQIYELAEAMNAIQDFAMDDVMKSEVVDLCTVE